MDRIYIIVRKDLPAGLKMAQACHSAFELSRSYPIKEKNPYLIVLEGSNRDLDNFIRRAEKIIMVQFKEPDLNNQLTSIAFYQNDTTKQLTKKFRLAT